MLIAHAGQGNDLVAGDEGQADHDLPAGARRLLASSSGSAAGYTDEQIRTYTFNMALSLADPPRSSGGSRPAEPCKIEKAGAKIVVHLLRRCRLLLLRHHDRDVQWKLVDEKPDVVQRFVNGTIEGWYSYLYGDATPANALI